MAGRAGRLGLSEEGRSILLAENSLKRRDLFDKYVLRKPEPIHSSFDPNDFETWMSLSPSGNKAMVHQARQAYAQIVSLRVRRGAPSQVSNLLYN